MTEREGPEIIVGYIKDTLGELLEQSNGFGRPPDPLKIAKLCIDSRIEKVAILTRQHLDRFKTDVARGVPATEIDPFPPENEEIERIQQELLKEGYTREELILAGVVKTREKRILEGRD